MDSTPSFYILEVRAAVHQQEHTLRATQVQQEMRAKVCECLEPTSFISVIARSRGCAVIAEVSTESFMLINERPSTTLLAKWLPFLAARSMQRSPSSATLLPASGRNLIVLVFILFIVACFTLTPALPAPKDRPPSASEDWGAPYVYKPRFPSTQRSYDISLVADLDMSTFRVADHRTAPRPRRLCCELSYRTRHILPLLHLLSLAAHLRRRHCAVID